MESAPAAKPRERRDGILRGPKAAVSSGCRARCRDATPLGETASRHAAKMLAFNNYAKNTTRTIPVVVLTRKA